MKHESIWFAADEIGRSTSEDREDYPRLLRMVEGRAILIYDDTDVPGGDEAEFGCALNAVKPGLRAFALSLTRLEHDADDLVQDTLLRAWQARSKFEPGSNIKAWTFTILRNVFLSQRRRDRFHGTYDDGVAERTLFTAAAQANALEFSDVMDNIAKLPADQREAILLVGFHGRSYDQAAEEISVPVGTVKSRVSRARLALRALLESCGPQRGQLTKPSSGESKRESRIQRRPQTQKQRYQVWIG